jgi:hypothetical protein
MGQEMSNPCLHSNPNATETWRYRINACKHNAEIALDIYWALTDEHTPQGESISMKSLSARRGLDDHVHSNLNTPHCITCESIQSLRAVYQIWSLVAVSLQILAESHADPYTIDVITTATDKREIVSTRKEFGVLGCWNSSLLGRNLLVRIINYLLGDNDNKNTEKSKWTLSVGIVTLLLLFAMFLKSFGWLIRA